MFFMNENYTAIAFGRNNYGKRIYGAIFSLNLKEDVAECRGICAMAERRAIDVAYQGYSMEEAKKSIKGLQEITEENFPSVLTKTLNQKFLDGSRN